MHSQDVYLISKPAVRPLPGADAVINAWGTKLFYNFWRPITAIQLGDSDGNPRTVGQSNWVPFLTTPPYPEYTSGANNLSSAMCRSLQHFFGTDEMTFSMTTLVAAATQKTRVYHRFSDVIEDIVNARIYQGIHFRSADEVGRRTGKRAADWAYAHFFHKLGG